MDFLGYARNGSGVSFGLLQPLKDLKVEMIVCVMYFNIIIICLYILFEDNIMIYKKSSST